MHDFNIQLSDLAVKLTGMVAERLAYATKDSSPADRARILDMIETKLPDIIVNTMAKTTTLHSAAGISHFEDNLEEYANAYVQKFVGRI